MSQKDGIMLYLIYLHHLLLTFWLETGAKAEAEAAKREKTETTDLTMIML
jgi:transcriptional antiterminator Rof (Rho-off)